MCQDVGSGHPKGRSAAKEPRRGLTRGSVLTPGPTSCGSSHPLFAINARIYTAANIRPGGDVGDGVLVDAMEPDQGVEDEQARLDALDGLVQALAVVSVARRHGIAPVRRSHPAYRYMRDGDGDGDGVVGE